MDMNKGKKNKLLKQNLVTFRAILELFYESPHITIWNLPPYYLKAEADFRKNLDELHEILLTQDIDDLLFFLQYEKYKLKAEKEKEIKNLKIIPLNIINTHFNKIIKYLEGKKINKSVNLSEIDENLFSDLTNDTGEYMSKKTKELGIYEMNGEKENKTIYENLANFKSILAMFYASPSMTKWIKLPSYFIQAFEDLQKNLDELHLILTMQNTEDLLSFLEIERMQIKLGKEKSNENLNNCFLIVIKLHIFEIIKYLENKTFSIKKIDENIKGCLMDETGMYMNYKLLELDVYENAKKNKILYQNLIHFRNILEGFFGTPVFYLKAKAYFKKNLDELHEILLTQDIDDLLFFLQYEKYKLKAEKGNTVEKLKKKFLNTTVNHLNEIVKYLEGKKINKPVNLSEIDENLFVNLDIEGFLCERHKPNISEVKSLDSK